MRERIKSAGRTLLAGAIMVSPSGDNPGFFPAQDYIIRTQTADEQVIEQQEFSEEEKLRQLREKIDSFTWEDFDNDETVESLKAALAQGYLDVTGSKNYEFSVLNERTILFRRFSDFRDKAHELYPGYPIVRGQDRAIVPDIETINEKGYEHVYNLINLKGVVDFTDRDVHHPGYYLADMLWHVWLTEDVELNEERGELLNNPYFTPSDLNFEEAIGYYGGSIYSENNFSFVNFHLHLSKAISARFLVEKLGVDPEDIDGYGGIYIDFTPEEAHQLIAISLNSGISLEDLYIAYSNSNLDVILKSLSPYVFLRPDDRGIEGIRQDELDKDLYRGFRYAKIIDEGFDRYFSEEPEQ